MLILPFAVLLLQNFVFFQKALNAPDSPDGPIAKGVITSGVEQGFAITAWGVPVTILGLVIVITSVVRHIRTMEKGRLS